jgi:hypothetical protein
MSEQSAFDWAWDQTEVIGTTRVILMAIAKFVDASPTGEATMSQSTLAARAGIKRNSVKPHLDALLEAGIITVIDGGGVTSGKGRPTDSYRVNMVGNPTQVKGRKSDVSKGRKPDVSATYVGNPCMTNSPSRNSVEVGETPSGFTAPAPSGTDADVITVDYVQEDDVPTPGFEEDAPATPVKRGWVDDDADLAGIGRVRKPPQQAPAKEPKPLAKWVANDFVRHFLERCSAVCPPGIPEQVVIGFAGKKFKEWLATGVTPEVLMETIDVFFGDPQNLREIGQGYTLWQRYYYQFRHTVGPATAKVQRKAAPAQGGAIHNKAYRDFMGD